MLFSPKGVFSAKLKILIPVSNIYRRFTISTAQCGTLNIEKAPGRRKVLCRPGAEKVLLPGRYRRKAAVCPPLDEQQETPAALGFLDNLHEIVHILDRLPVDRPDDVADLDHCFRRRAVGLNRRSH